MAKLHPLIKGQSVRIDNHHPGTPIRWDWGEGEQPDDVHLDKTLDSKVNGKYVKVRVTLNHDNAADAPKKAERRDNAWMDAYNQMVREVNEVLRDNEAVRDQLVEDVKNAIREIRPNKPNRAMRKALCRIADHFDIPEENLIKMEMVNRGIFCLFMDKEEHLCYVGFGRDRAFYIGRGDGRDFSRRVRGYKHLLRGILGYIGRKMR